MAPSNPENHTPIQRFRLDQELWDAFGERAVAVGTNRSRLIGQFVRWYLQEPRAVLPLRAKRRTARDLMSGGRPRKAAPTHEDPA